MMHGGPPAALLAREVQRTQPGDDLVVTRLTIELLGGVPLGPVTVASSVARPGRRFQVVDATLDAGGRRSCLARAVRVRRAEMPGAARIAACGHRRQRPCSRRRTASRWRRSLFYEHDREMFYPGACEIRHVAGELGSGVVAAWIRLRGEVVAGEEPSQLERVAAAADFANGLSWILPIADWLYVNTELTIHLAREPQGEWIGLDARTSMSGAGFGLSTATLHDLHGPFGACAQSLFVEPR